MLAYSKANPDLVFAAIFAVMTAFFAPLSRELYVSYANIPLLMTLFCLMVVIAGCREGGMLTYLYRVCFHGTSTLRQVGQFFIFVCFFLSMVVTNDVSLLLFVPLCMVVLQTAKQERYLIYVLTMQTIAANLGSMLTPIGNPQNLFLYEYYKMNLGDFLAVTAPLTIVSGILLYGTTRYIPKLSLQVPALRQQHMSKRRNYLFSVLFILCILAVLRVLTPALLLCIVVPVAALVDKTLYKRVDYKLLMLFILLFIGVGNLRHIPAFAALPDILVTGHPFWAGIILSQFISNVPATVLIAPYTHDIPAVLAGVNIGGLGTMIASIASIITLKAYAAMPGRRLGRYILFFTASNVAFLIILVIFWLMFWV